MRHVSYPVKTAAIVLAAGMSSRMGSPKQLARLGNATLLERTLQWVRQTAVEEVVLVLGFAADAVSRSVPLEDTKIVWNESYEEGMATSLKKGLSAIAPNTAAALVVLADQPFVRPETIDTLVQTYHSSGTQIAIPTYRGFRGNPVLLDRSVFPEVLGLSGDIGCRAIFGDHLEGILRVPVNDPGILLDADMPDDLERLRQLQSAAARETLEQLPDLVGTPVEGQPELVLVGRDDVVLALARLGRMLHFAVTVVDPFLAPHDLPDAHRILHVLDFSRLPPNTERYIVVASRGQFDEEALESALCGHPPYVGLVAGAKRARELTRRLGVKGTSPEALASLHAPAGLAIGAGTPEEIALSVMAEIVSQRTAALKSSGP